MPPSSPKVRLFTIKTAQFLMTILFLFLIYALSRQAAALVLASSASAQAAPPTVVIDSGHGGNDPGKNGVDGTLEKDLNLTIARKLKYYLEASGVHLLRYDHKRPSAVHPEAWIFHGIHRLRSA